MIVGVLVTGADGIEVATHLPQEISKVLNETRRIINGDEVTDGRPYMVGINYRPLSD